MVDCLNDRSIVDVYVRNRCSNIIFDAMIAVKGDEEDSKASSSSWQVRCLSSFSLLQTLNEIQSEKLSIILSPGENSK